MAKQFRDVLDVGGSDVIDPRWATLRQRSPDHFADVVVAELAPGEQANGLRLLLRNSCVEGGIRINWRGVEWTPAAQLEIYERARRRQRPRSTAGRRRATGNVPSELIERYDLRPNAARVLHALAGCAGGEKSVAIAVWRLARRCRLAEKTTKRQLRHLEDLELISRLYTSPGGISNTYRLNFLSASRECQAEPDASSASRRRDDRQLRLEL